MTRTTPRDLRPNAEADRVVLDEQIDAYLDGVLGVAEARALERRFAEVTVADALAEAIAFRDLLATGGGETAPAGLADRIIDTLGFAEEPEPLWVQADAGDVDEAGVGRRGARKRRRVRDAVRVAGGLLQGARVLARAGDRSGKRGERAAGPAWAGVSTMRYALGPLGLVGAVEEPPQSLLKRVMKRRGDR